MKIITDEVVVAVLFDCVDEGAEGACITERVGAYSVEDCGQAAVQWRAGKCMLMSEILDVFGEVAKEEDVVFADFAGYFDLFPIY